MTPRRARRVFVGLFLLFAAPPVIAWVVYAGFGWRGTGRAAAGQLVSPPQPVPTTALVAPVSGAIRRSAQRLAGHWTLLQIAPEGCAAGCRAGLRASRQVRALLHRRAARVERVLLLGDNTSALDRSLLQPDLAIYRTNIRPWQSMSAARNAAAPGTILLIDPSGRWMAFYASPERAAALHHDLTRLLAMPGSS